MRINKVIICVNSADDANSRDVGAETKVINRLYIVSGKRVYTVQYSRHNFDKFRLTFVIFDTNNPYFSVLYEIRKFSSTLNSATRG